MNYIKKKEISIILPSYNGSKYIEKAIKSILNQSYKNFDFYLLNNKSTDNTLKIMMNFKKIDNRIKVINNKFRSKTTSVNQIVNKIKTKWISVIDDDDIHDKDRLKIQIQYLKKNKDVKALSCLATYITNGQKNFGISSNLLVNKNSCFELIKKAKNIGVCNPGTIIETRIFKELKGYRDIFPAEDIDLWNRMALSGHIIFALPKVLVKYRLHSNSVTTSKYWLTFFSTLYLKNNLNNLKKKKNLISINNFKKKFNKKSILFKINIYRKYLADYIFRLSAIYYLEKRKIFFLLFQLISFLLRPIKYLNKFLRRLKLLLINSSYKF